MLEEDAGVQWGNGGGCRWLRMHVGECTFGVRSLMRWALLTDIRGMGAQVDCSLLRELHPHVRDARLRFQADTHTYFLDGRPTLGSLA